MTMPDIFCLICDATLDVSSCTNIFYTYLPRSGELLSNFVSLVLRVTVSDLHSSYICSQCCNLFEMLEQAQWTVLNVRCEIFKIYRSSNRKKSIKESPSGGMEMNLSTSILFKGTKPEANIQNVKFKEDNNLNPIDMEETTEQSCAQTKQPNLSTLNVDSMNNVDVPNEISNEKVNNGIRISNIDVKRDLSKGAVCKNPEKNESMNFIKQDQAFSENKVRAESVSRSIDFTWKEIEERVSQVKKNSECNTDNLNLVLQDATDIDETISEKVLKYDTKHVSYSCPTCAKKCRTATDLKTHVKSHSALRPYMCEKCGQAYKHKHALDIHVGMHNGINPFQCSFCNKCFTQKGALMRHLPIHTGEMAYQCELCGKRFKHHTSYNMHRLSHSGKKSYQCHMCDLSLLSTSHLKRHMRVHTGEKPYSCALCGKRFAERYNLLAHQKRELHDQSENKGKKTKESKYKCDNCNLVFENKESLEDHRKSHNGVGIDNNLEPCKDFHDVPKNGQLSKNVESEDSALKQTWIQMNRSKLDAFNNQTKFLFLQNPLSEITENSFAITFGEQKMSLESANYSTSLQVIIDPSEATTLNTHLPTDSMHM